MFTHSGTDLVCLSINFGNMQTVRLQKLPIEIPFNSSFLSLLPLKWRNFQQVSQSGWLGGWYPGVGTLRLSLRKKKTKCYKAAKCVNYHLTLEMN